jgi:predicted transcriptional regulator
VVLKNKASKETFVHEIMDKELITNSCWQDRRLHGVNEHKKIRHLPVIDNQIVVGNINGRCR